MADVIGSDRLVGFLRSLGAGDDDIAAAADQCALAQLPSDLVLARGATLDAGELARRAGVGTDEVVALWRTLGIVGAENSRRIFTERDSDFTTFALQFKPMTSQTDELFRVLGTSLARVAEAAVSLYVQTIEPTLDTPGVDVVAWAEHLAETTAKALALGDYSGTIFAHHLRDAIDRQRVAQAEVSEPSLFRLAVGFVDLVGFTPLSQYASPDALLRLIGGFEARAHEVASAHDGRIIKHIGDEVMFVALDAGAGCSIARELTFTQAEGIQPRGGVAFGDVISRYGDYYGPVVNMAARLAELAIPREVLVDASAAVAGAEDFRFRPAGHRVLKGFDAPVEVFSIDFDS
jgi:adenylate cyclase